MRTSNHPQRATQWVSAIAVVILLGVLGLCWAAYRTVLFVADLPNRIEIEIDSEVIAGVVNHSLLYALTDGEDHQRLEVLREIASGPLEQPEYRTWIDEQFGEVIDGLVGHPNLKIAGQAAQLQAAIGATPREQ